MIVYPIREERKNKEAGTDDGAHLGGAAAQDNSVFLADPDCSNSHCMDDDNNNLNNRRNDDNNNLNNRRNDDNEDNSSRSDINSSEKDSSCSSSSDNNHDNDDNKQNDTFPLRIQYCPSNPCITRIVHGLHKQILDGIEGADVELNRYLTVCSFLSQNSSICKDAEDPPASSCTWEAQIILDCMCGREAHAIRLTKRAYQQQFRLGRRCSFLCLSAAAAAGPGGATIHTAHHKRLAAATATRPLHVPLQALIPPRHVALQHSLLPDLGASMRMVLQRRFFTEHSRKQWVKAASNIQVGLDLSMMYSNVGSQVSMFLTCP